MVQSYSEGPAKMTLPCGGRFCGWNGAGPRSRFRRGLFLIGRGYSHGKTLGCSFSAPDASPRKSQPLGALQLLRERDLLRGRRTERVRLQNLSVGQHNIA